MVRRVTVLAGIGLLGAGLTAVAALLAAQGWGPPGSPAYATYEVANRVAALGILLATTGPLALRRALAGRGQPGVRPSSLAAVAILVAAAGTAAEFLVFSDAPYQGAGSEGRLVAFMAFFVAAFTLLGVTAIAGLVLVGRSGVPAWIGPVLVAAAIAGLVVSLAGQSLFAGIAIVAAVLAIAAIGAAARR